MQDINVDDEEQQRSSSAVMMMMMTAVAGGGLLRTLPNGLRYPMAVTLWVRLIRMLSLMMM